MVSWELHAMESTQIHFDLCYGHRKICNGDVLHVVQIGVQSEYLADDTGILFQDS